MPFLIGLILDLKGTSERFDEQLLKHSHLKLILSQIKQCNFENIARMLYAINKFMLTATLDISIKSIPHHTLARKFYNTFAPYYCKQVTAINA